MIDNIKAGALWVFVIVFAVSILTETANAGVFDWFKSIKPITVVEEEKKGFTIKTGQVLTSNGVMDADKTESGKRALAQDGYLISGGNFYLQIEDNTVTIPLSDLTGKSKNQMKELITEEATAQISDAISGAAFDEATAKAEAQAAHVADLVEQGINVVDTVEEAMNSGGISTAVDAANEAVAQAVEQAARDFVENHPDNAEAIADGHDVSGGPGGPRAAD